MSSAHVSASGDFSKSLLLSSVLASDRFPLLLRKEPSPSATAASCTTNQRSVYCFFRRYLVGDAVCVKDKNQADYEETRLADGCVPYGEAQGDPFFSFYACLAAAVGRSAPAGDGARRVGRLRPPLHQGLLGSLPALLLHEGERVGAGDGRRRLPDGC